MNCENQGSWSTNSFRNGRDICLYNIHCFAPSHLCAAFSSGINPRTICVAQDQQPQLEMERPLKDLLENKDLGLDFTGWPNTLEMLPVNTASSGSRSSSSEREMKVSSAVLSSLYLKEKPPKLMAEQEKAESPPSKGAGHELEQPLGSLHCERCNKTFTRTSSVVRHQATCMAVCLIPCEHCDQTFSRIDNLRQHMQRKHGFGPSLNCSFCGIRFRSKVRLDEHLMVCKKA